MSILFDFFPILLFFIAYKMGDIYIATATAIAASILQVLISRFVKGTVQNIHWFTLAAIILLGGLTLLLKDERFIKMKPTVVYWILSAVFFISHFIGERPILQRLVENSLKLPKVVWRQLNMSWILFFFAMGGLNLYVVENFDTDTWVNFKLFGTLLLTIIFIIGQGVYMARHIQSDNGNG